MNPEPWEDWAVSAWNAQRTLERQTQEARQAELHRKAVEKRRKAKRGGKR